MAFADLVTQIDRSVQGHLGSTTITYAPAVGDAVNVEAIFDDAYVLVDQGQTGVEQVGPVVWLRLEDLPVNPEDDEPTITIGAHTYTVRERQTDGVVGGTVRLLLLRSVI